MKIFLPVAVSEDHSSSEGPMYEINDQPRQGRYRSIFRTPFSELAGWLCANLNNYPGPVIDTDLTSPPEHPSSPGHLDS
jgi:hypothetical protein